MSPVLCFLLAAIPSADTVLVCPQPFQSAMQPWIEYRQGQGHIIEIVDTSQSAEQIRTAIRNVAKAGKLQAIVLVGDVAAAKDIPDQASIRLPTHLAKAKINIHWGSESHIATDNWYADLDDDQIPDVAIGRLTADNVDDVKTMVEKVISYERAGVAPWCRRLNFVAGVGGFGALADSILEMSTKTFLTSGIPASYSTTMTYGSWRSPYCPDPKRFHDVTMSRLNEGCLFWIYVGHGQKWYLDRIRVPGSNYHIMDIRDANAMNCQHGSPIAIFLACYTGAFDAQYDCLAEEMLRRPKGPIAVFSGSRVTMPYAMAVMGDGLMTEYFQNKRPTLGETILHAKRRMIDVKEKNSNRQMLDAIAATISPARDHLDEERKEHLLLFNLLGDPLLRLPHPESLDLKSEFNVSAGQSVKISGQSPLAGSMNVELVVRRDRLRQPAPTRTKYDPTPDNLESYQQVYKAANDHRLATLQVPVQPGPFEFELQIPVDARSLCHVRALVQGKQNTMALGACDIFVRRAKPTAAE